MFKVEIKKNNQVSNSAKFKNQQELDGWINHHKQSGVFGKEAHTKEVLVKEEIPAIYEDRHFLIKDAVLDEDGNIVTPAEYETKRVLVSEAVPAEYETVQVPAEYEVVVTDVSDEAAIKEAHKTLLKETYSRMEEAFGTSNTDTATANYNTYMLMKDEPSLFIGDLFLTNEDVLAFAESKLVSIKNYAKWRIERIAEFEEQKKAIKQK